MTKPKTEAEKKKTAASQPKKKDPPKKKAELAKVQPVKLQPFQTESIIKTTQDLAIMGRYMSESGFFPELDAVAKACMVIEKGRELGILPVSSGQVIHPIRTQDGMKLAIEAKLYGAIAMNAGVRWKAIKKDKEGCILEFWSIVDKTIPVHTETFTLEDAARAGLSEKKNWVWYPEEMCYNRCLIKGLRYFDPRICMGLYSVEEVNDFEKISDDGGGSVYVLPEEGLNDKDIIPEAEQAPTQTVSETLPEDAKRPVSTDKIEEAEDFGESQYSEAEEVQAEEPAAEDPPEEKAEPDFMPFEEGPTPEEINTGQRQAKPAPTDPGILIYKQVVTDYMKVQGMGDLYSTFKEWLSVFQTSREPMRNFVERNQFGKWSLEKGSIEDLKVLASNIKWTMDTFIDYCFKELGLEKVGFHTHPGIQNNQE